MRWLRWAVTMMFLAGLYAACGGGGGSSTTGPTGSGSGGTPAPPASPPAPTGDGGGGDGGAGGGGGGGGGAGASLSTVRFRSVEVTVTPPDGGRVSDNFGRNGSAVQGCTHCTERYRVGTRVVLSAQPNPGFIFDHWEGAACDASPLPTCSLSIEADTRLAAVFR